ncbi:9089_t:CDS:2 [Acaulospora morrowiae]|uniref:9089_t:CDS:1 n=1 Tax=Acaulospora morrowiae TaxID=94023 RepID=A0A9N9FWI4_9GLOM|nr:9089_t:CDS:2 [Acaulospora morrowiae]
MVRARVSTGTAVARVGKKTTAVDSKKSRMPSTTNALASKSRGRRFNTEGVVSSIGKRKKQDALNEAEYVPSDEEQDDFDSVSNAATVDARSAASQDMTELLGLLQSTFINHHIVHGAILTSHMDKSSKFFVDKKNKSNSRFNKFEQEQEARIQETRDMIYGDSGIVSSWEIEMENIIINLKRKADEKIEREDEFIKKLKLGFEKYQSSATKTLDDLTKFYARTQRARREFDNEIKQLYIVDETELNEALENFMKSQRHARRSLLSTNKVDEISLRSREVPVSNLYFKKEIHDVMELKKQLAG